MDGEWPDAIRHLQQGVGPCGDRIFSCSPLAEELRQGLVQEEREALQKMWKQAFAKGSVEIDFVCTDPKKLMAIKRAMLLADVVPLSFSMKEHPAGYTDRVRFVIEV